MPPPPPPAAFRRPPTISPGLTKEPTSMTTLPVSLFHVLVQPPPSLSTLLLWKPMIAGGESTPLSIAMSVEHIVNMMVKVIIVASGENGEQKGPSQSVE
jgi:hypothetical protein